MAPQPIDFSVLDNTAETVAPMLLGCELIRYFESGITRVKIVEVEAYDQGDIASHSYNGETPRTRVMFGEAGHLYVYFTYGMHYCCNIVVGQKGYGSAVLIRAVEPIAGKTFLEMNRNKSGIDLTNGPAKLCQALKIDKQFNGHNLHDEPLKLILKPPLQKSEISTTTRIGISKAKEMLWRFYITNNPFVSKD